MPFLITMFRLMSLKRRRCEVRGLVKLPSRRPIIPITRAPANKPSITLARARLQTHPCLRLAKVKLRRCPSVRLQRSAIHRHPSVRLQPSAIHRHPSVALRRSAIHRHPSVALRRSFMRRITAQVSLPRQAQRWVKYILHMFLCCYYQIYQLIIVLTFSRTTEVDPPNTAAPGTGKNWGFGGKNPLNYNLENTYSDLGDAVNKGAVLGGRL